MYFWGQLDLPKGEKTKKKQSSITASATPLNIIKLPQKQQSGSSPAEYKVGVMGDAGKVDNHLAVVGKPFEVKISKRDESTSNSACMVICSNSKSCKRFCVDY